MNEDATTEETAAPAPGTVVGLTVGTPPAETAAADPSDLEAALVEAGVDVAAAKAARQRIGPPPQKAGSLHPVHTNWDEESAVQAWIDRTFDGQVIRNLVWAIAKRWAPAPKD